MSRKKEKLIGIELTRQIRIPKAMTMTTMPLKLRSTAEKFNANAVPTLRIGMFLNLRRRLDRKKKKKKRIGILGCKDKNFPSNCLVLDYRHVVSLSLLSSCVLGVGLHARYPSPTDWPRSSVKSTNWKLLSIILEEMKKDVSGGSCIALAGLGSNFK